MAGGNANLTIWQIGIRCILSAMLLALVGLLPALDIAVNPFDREILFTEFSFVQITQSATLMLALLVCGYLLYNNVLPQLFPLFMSLLAFAMHGTPVRFVSGHGRRRLVTDTGDADSARHHLSNDQTKRAAANPGRLAVRSIWPGSDAVWLRHCHGLCANVRARRNVGAELTHRRKLIAM